MSHPLAVMVAVLVGMSITSQGSVNTLLARHVGPLAASLVSFTAGICLLLVAIAFAGAPGLRSIPGAPPWLLLAGGTMGVIVVCGTVLAVRVIGVGATMTLAVSAQLALAMVIDHFAPFDLPRVAISPARLIGIALVVGGTILVVR